MYSVMWSEHCSYKSLEGAPAPVRREGAEDRRAARRHRRERRRRRHRRGLGGHLQGRVAQPPVLRRAVPGRGHRRRRHRPRHPLDGRPAGRGDGPAAVRPGRRRGHPAGAARRRRRHRRLRQLPGPAQHRRRGRLRPVATPATRWSTRSASACCAHEDIKLAHASGAGNLVVLFGARDRRRRHRRGLGAGVARRSTTRSPTKRPSVQVGDPFAEKVLIECCLEVFAADLVVGIQDLGGAGLSCATSELGVGRRRRHARRARPGAAARRVAGARGDPDERVAGAHVRGRRRRSKLDAFLADLREVGRRWPPSSARSTTRGRLTVAVARRDRSSTCRRAPSRTTARSTSGRSPGRPGRTRCRPTDRTTLPRPSTGDELRATLLQLVGRAQPRVASVGHRPVRPLRPRQHRARPAGGRRRDPGRRGDAASASRWPPTATAATPGSTRTPARSWRWPRPTATSRSPAPGRSRSPTASTSARPRTRRSCGSSPRRSAASPTPASSSASRSPAATSASTTRPATCAIHPTPVVGVLGVHRRRRAAGSPIGFRAPDEVVLLLGETRDEFGGSEWAHAVHGHLGGLPPRVDLAAEQALARADGGGGRRRAGRPRRTTCPTAAWPRRWSRWCCAAASARAVDCSDGDPFVALFSESVARAVVAVPADRVADLEASASSYGVPVTRLGTTGGETLAVQGVLTVGVDELRTAHEGTLPALFA